MLTPANINEYIDTVNADNVYTIHALKALSAALEFLWSSSYPVEQASREMFDIQWWFNYIRLPGCVKNDLGQCDLGSVYRDIARMYNFQADNLRDESHTIEVER